MKLNISYFLGLILLFINVTIAKNDENSFNNKKVISNKDNYYLIFVNNTYGEYRIFKNSKKDKRQESQIFVETLLDEIDDLIINNKNTYQHPEKLNEIEETSKLLKRNEKNVNVYNYDNSNFVHPISSVGDSLVLYAYLSKILVQKIEKMSYIKSVELDNVCYLHNEDYYYNYDDILTETNWGNITVNSNADFHLSILSQGRYDPNLVHQYDNNYYFPSSAGKDVDIIVIDTNFHFDNPEFSNKEREAKCIGSVHKDGTVTPPSNELICGYNDDDHTNNKKIEYYHIDHGAKVSDIAAGIKHGVASGANIYGVSIPADPDGSVYISDVYQALEWIKEIYIRPHQTIINLSNGFKINLEKMDEFYEKYQQYKLIIEDITKKGGIIVSSAGNNKEYLDGETELMIPCELNDVICVGGIDNNSIYLNSTVESDKNKIYNRHISSNYGNNVNIYAPYRAIFEYVQSSDYKYVKINENGTSYSSPIVAGLIAQLISQNPNKIYNKDDALKELLNNSKENYFYYTDKYNKYHKAIIANNGKHIVYSPDNIYYGCGILAGNRSCDYPNNTMTNTTIIPIKCNNFECLDNNDINIDDIVEV